MTTKRIKLTSKINEPFIAHKCNGEKWRPYQKGLCSLCRLLSDSFDMGFDSRQQYNEYTKQ